MRYLMYVVVQCGTQVITSSKTIEFNTEDDMNEDAKAEAMRFVGIKEDDDLVEVVLIANGFNNMAPRIAYQWSP